MKRFSTVTARKVVGLDLGDRHRQLVVLEGKSGKVVETGPAADHWQKAVSRWACLPARWRW